jgi:hypothetical protein
MEMDVCGRGDGNVFLRMDSPRDFVTASARGRCIISRRNLYIYRMS